MTAARAARASALTYRLCWIAESGEPAAEESQTRNAGQQGQRAMPGCLQRLQEDPRHPR
jgi:hypothetical protein